MVPLTSTTEHEAGQVLLSARRVSAFAGGEDANHLVLEEVSLQLNAGELLAIVGPSGVGKSTLLKVLAGLLPAIDGDQTLISRPRGIALQPQESVLILGASARANIEKVALALGASRNMATQEARRLLDLVELASVADVVTSKLSVGMRQRVALARTLAAKVGVFLFDEPFSALDLPTRQRIALRLRKRADELGHGYVMVTHTIEEAVLVADRIYVLQGRPARIVVVAGRADAALGADPYVREDSVIVSDRPGVIFEAVIEAFGGEEFRRSSRKELQK